MFRKRKPKNICDPKAEGTRGDSPESVRNPTEPVKERPRICLIDVGKDIAATLRGREFNCYEGSLGPLVEVNNTSPGSIKRCLLSCDFPANLHEYDIVIVDLQQPETVPYIEQDHRRGRTKGYRELVLVSSFPETIFDPRALSASGLESKLQPFMEKESILLIFAAKHETMEYQPLAMTPGGPEPRDLEKRSLYDFYPDLPLWRNVTGKDTRVVLEGDPELAGLLERHNERAVYSITFQHPTHWENGRMVEDKNFIPLMEARPGEIVSFACIREKNFTFFFPGIEQKEAFLIDLLESVLPGIKPELFPFSTQFAWLADPEYQLPNEEELLEHKANLQAEYETRLKEVNERIEANRQEYGFLHDLLTESGPALVKTVERCLRWLGFDNIVNVDETNPDLQEEDLRVENERGMLVIEVKGIGGTSTDSECSQISKIKYRRSKERDKFDVFALYIVNHQRYLPPSSRSNPPFNATQIADAKNDERGLLTTFDLFNLYFNVTNGYITKDGARDALYQTGLVRFKPSGARLIPGPYESHYDGYVVVFRGDELEVHLGMSIVLEEGGRYRSARILEIQVDGNPVECASGAEIGLKLSERVSKETTLWLVGGG